MVKKHLTCNQIVIQCQEILSMFIRVLFYSFIHYLMSITFLDDIKVSSVSRRIVLLYAFELKVK
jgi:hypothetical protein